MVTAKSKAVLPNINENGGKSRIQDSDFEIQTELTLRARVLMMRSCVGEVEHTHVHTPPHTQNTWIYGNAGQW